MAGSEAEGSPHASKARVTATAALALLLLLGACGPQPRHRGFPGPEMMPAGAIAVDADSVPGIPGFSLAVKRGLTLYISGQVPLDSSARLIGDGNLAAQTDQAVQNLLRVVRAGRGLPGDVVKLTFYVTGMDSLAAATVQHAAAQAFTESPPPAITIVGVSALPGQGIRVAVDGLAMLRGEFPDRERPQGFTRAPQ